MTKVGFEPRSAALEADVSPLYHQISFSGRDRLDGLVVKASASGAEDPGFESHLRRDVSVSSHTSDLKLALHWLPCQAPGVIGSALGLVGPVSVYCDWLRENI